MKLKSQVSVYLIFGLLILLLFIFVFSLFDYIENPFHRKNVNEVASFIESSLEITSKQCANKVGIQGGRYISQTYLEKPYSYIEYAYLEVDNFLSLNEIKSEMQSCITEILPLHIDGFSSFEKRGYKINYGEITPDIVFGAGDITASVKFPITAEIGEETYYLEEVSTRIAVRMKRLYNITKTITERREMHLAAKDIDMTYLGSIDVNTTVYDEGNSQDIYSLKDHKSRIGSKDFFFLACNKY